MPERSRVWAEARSSIHPIRVETAGFEGELEADVPQGPGGLPPPTRIQLAVELLKSNNSLVDVELRRKLEARKHPRIEGRLREARPLPGSRCLLRGALRPRGRWRWKRGCAPPTQTRSRSKARRPSTCATSISPRPAS